MEFRHIKVVQDNSGITKVEVEDTELFDFIEDYLTEDCDLKYDYMETSEKEALTIHTMFFQKKFPKEVIETALSKLETAQIESIFKINNN